MSMTPENDMRGWREMADAVMGNVPLPAGAVSVDEWGDALTPHAFRLFDGTTRTVELNRDGQVDVVIRGTQSADGTVEERGVLIYGEPDDPMPAAVARRLGAALIAAADEIDGLAEQ